MKKREAYFDNARLILIVFVVFGHLVSPIKNENRILDTLYTSIYLFHMAGFILISGYFSKNFRRPGYIGRIAKKSLYPYIIFQIIYFIDIILTNNLKESSLDIGLDFIFYPRFTLWFLLSLFSWNLLLFVFTKLGKYSIFIAFGLGMIVGVFDINTFLSLTRTFMFFPFFLIGYYLQADFFKKIRKNSYRILSIFILAAIFIAFYVYPFKNNTEWLMGAYSYTYMGVENLRGIITRLIQYVLMLISVLSILSLIPNKNFKFTDYGTRTIYIYLLHGIIIKMIRNHMPQSLYNSFSNNIPLFVLATLIIVLFLGSKSVKKITYHFIERGR